MQFRYSRLQTQVAISLIMSNNKHIYNKNYAKYINKNHTNLVHGTAISYKQTSVPTAYVTNWHSCNPMVPIYKVTVMHQMLVTYLCQW